ncbi:hypothetical protein OAG68_01615 [bacterium]|nr:hypothetical protein [bacterium]
MKNVNKVSAVTTKSRRSGSVVGKTVVLRGFYRVPNIGIDGWINFLEPEGATPNAFPFWQECHLVNGTFNHQLFYQELKIYDNSGALVDSFVVSIHMPPMLGVGEWVVSQNTNLPNGLYELTGEVGYFDPVLGTQILDQASTEFTVANF